VYKPRALVRTNYEVQTKNKQLNCQYFRIRAAVVGNNSHSKIWKQNGKWVHSVAVALLRGWYQAEAQQAGRGTVARQQQQWIIQGELPTVQ
jgi:hypothetical protein